MRHTSPPGLYVAAYYSNLGSIFLGGREDQGSQSELHRPERCPHTVEKDVCSFLESLKLPIKDDGIADLQESLQIPHDIGLCIVMYHCHLLDFEGWSLSLTSIT
jgi:hypothetical protein